MSPNSRKSFSRRQGFSSQNREITIRYKAPEELREALLQIAKEAGLTPKPLRLIICGVLRRVPDRNNWTDYPNVWNEVQDLIFDCEWFKVYDVAEAISNYLIEHQEESDHKQFEELLNEYFMEKGIGWQIENGQIVTRGSESFETLTSESAKILSNSGRPTASNEIHEAINDLSRRPEPDITGAIQHGMAALECVARDVCGDSNATLGKIIEKYPDRHDIPKPLDEAVIKLWGYSSNIARHIREGKVPNYEEAELVVSISAIVASYLSKKNV